MKIEVTLDDDTIFYVLEDDTIQWNSTDDEDPVTLIGFVIYLSTAQKEIIDVDHQIFRDIHYLAVDKYPVFRNLAGEWVGLKHKVTAVELIDEE